jgi:hypothetical protein
VESSLPTSAALLVAGAEAVLSRAVIVPHVVQQLADQMRPHRGEGHDHRGHRRPELRVDVVQRVVARRRGGGWLRAGLVPASCDLCELRGPSDVRDTVPVAVPQDGGRHRPRQILDVLQRLKRYGAIGDHGRSFRAPNFPHSAQGGGKFGARLEIPRLEAVLLLKEVK